MISRPGGCVPGTHNVTCNKGGISSWWWSNEQPRGGSKSSFDPSEAAGMAWHWHRCERTDEGWAASRVAVDGLDARRARPSASATPPSPPRDRGAGWSAPQTAAFRSGDGAEEAGYYYDLPDRATLSPPRKFVVRESGRGGRPAMSARATIRSQRLRIERGVDRRKEAGEWR